MWEGIIAGAALALSIVTYLHTRRRSNELERMKMYLDLERELDLHIYALLIQHDFLNMLFFENPRVPPPSPKTRTEDLTPENRALLHFAGMLLDYFEQLVVLRETMPEGAPKTWESWIESCAKAPYFRWAWLTVGDVYDGRLQLEFDPRIEGRLQERDWKS